MNLNKLLDQALSYCQSGNFSEARRLYIKIIQEQPNNSEALSNLGTICLREGNIDSGIAYIEKSLSININQPALYNNLGIVYKGQKKFLEAIKRYNEAIKLKKDFYAAYYNRGISFQELGRIEDALSDYNKAIELNPNFAEAYNNRGNMLSDLCKISQALESYDYAIALKPDFYDSYRNKAYLKLMLGEYSEGWNLHEYRWQVSAFRNLSKEISKPIWLGKENVTGKRVLIVAEQGIGDFIQFFRYAPLLTNVLGAKVFMETYKELTSLIRENYEYISLLEIGQHPEHYDFYIPIMSLPLAFDTTLDNIPNKIPYIYPNKLKSINFKNKITKSNKMKIGLVWSGGFRSDQPELWAVNKRRNVPFSQIQALFDLNVDFFSLQKGEQAESELNDFLNANKNIKNIINFTDQLDDFSDTAALIDNLDLIISVDTSTAHLAAAMGKPVWLLNRFDTCWRWMLSRSDSPWYPTIRIFRQKKLGDWENVLSEVIHEIKKLTSSNS